MYRNVLVATDGSALADHAVSHGLSLAKSVGAKVTVVIVEAPFNIYDLPASRTQEISDFITEYSTRMRQHANSVLSHVADKANAAGVPCETVHCEHDFPYKAIIATAEAKGCDVIVMASHGRSGMSAMLLGSVTNQVLTHTKLPVLVCH